MNESSKNVSIWILTQSVKPESVGEPKLWLDILGSYICVILNMPSIAYLDFTKFK